MKLYVYSVFDSKSRCYSNPFYMANDGMAIRAFTDNVNNKESTSHHHPEDYSLYLLGDYDDTTGEIECKNETRKLLVTATQVQNKEPEIDKLDTIIKMLEKSNVTDINTARN